METFNRIGRSDELILDRQHYKSIPSTLTCCSRYNGVNTLLTIFPFLFSCSHSLSLSTSISLSLSLSLPLFFARTTRASGCQGFRLHSVPGSVVATPSPRTGEGSETSRLPVPLRQESCLQAQKPHFSSRD